MKITILGRQGDILCVAANQELRKLGMPFDEQDIDEVLALKPPELMKKLEKVDGVLPIIVINGSLFTPKAAYAKIRQASGR